MFQTVFNLQKYTMITDTISNATRYAALHPDFAEAFHLLQTLDFAKLPDGQVPYENPNIRIFIGSETYGWIDRGRLKNGLGYNEKRDIEFFDCEPETWLTLEPGEFALFFPNDAHAPLVGDRANIRKAVFKIRIETERL